MTRVRLYGVDVDAVTVDSTLAWIADTIASGARRRIVTLNTTGLMLAERVAFYRDFVARADLVVADGQPLVWLSPIFGPRLPGRVAGIDLLEQLARQAADRGHSLYLVGAESNTVAAAAAELEHRNPGLRLAGFHHGYLGDGAAEVAAGVRRSGAQILLVGMGSPRQEEFIERYWDDLGVNVAIGVGGSFEVLAKRLHRAPRCLQRLGLEWAFRMLQEPRRLGRRYLETLVWLLRRTAPMAQPAGLRRKGKPLPDATHTAPNDQDENEKRGSRRT